MGDVWVDRGVDRVEGREHTLGMMKQRALEVREYVGDVYVGGGWVGR